MSRLLWAKREVEVQSLLSKDMMHSITYERNRQKAVPFGSIINVGVLKGDDFGAPTFFAKKRAWS
jgi:hypothetical protein